MVLSFSSLGFQDYHGIQLRHNQSVILKLAQGYIITAQFDFSMLPLENFHWHEAGLLLRGC